MGCADNLFRVGQERLRFLHDKAALGVVPSEATATCVCGYGELQTTALRRKELQRLSDVELELVRAPVVDDDAVLGQATTRFGRFELIDGLDGADDRIGAEEELQHRGVTGWRSRGGGDDAVHVVGHQHGVGAFLHVAVLNKASGAFIQKLQHLVRGCSVEPLVGNKLVDLIIVQEALHATCGFPEVGKRLHGFLVGPPDGVGTALL